MFKLNEDKSLKAIAVAENSGIDNSEDWVLENFRETRFEDNKVTISSARKINESFELNSDLLGVTLVKPISLSVRELSGYVGYLKKNDLSANRYEVELCQIFYSVKLGFFPSNEISLIFQDCIPSVLPDRYQKLTKKK